MNAVYLGRTEFFPPPPFRSRLPLSCALHFLSVGAEEAPNPGLGGRYRNKKAAQDLSIHVNDVNYQEEGASITDHSE